MIRSEACVLKFLRNGQAMLETVFAVLIVTVLFLTLFQLSQYVQARIMLDHAAARAARARAVGFNDFMCRKSARVAMIPVAGKQLIPLANPTEETMRVPLYLTAESEGHARAILDYERWQDTSIDVSSGNGIGARAEAKLLLATDDLRMDGSAKIESHYPLYLWDIGK